MNKALVATTAAALSLLSTAVLAADLPARTAPIFAPPPPVFTWSGGYFGVNAGYAFDYNTNFRSQFFFAGGAPNQLLDRRGLGDDGFTAGGQVGYNYQFGAASGIVVGFEADAAYTDLGKTRTFDVTNLNAVTPFGSGSAANIATVRFHTGLDFLGTVRGRIGYALDRILIYGTGGFAYGDLNTRIVDTFQIAPAPAAAFRGGRSGIQTGYAYGGGIEYALPTDSFLQNLNFFRSSAVTIKAEYLHYDLGSQRFRVYPTPADPTGNFFATRVSTDGDLARVGINYKF